MKKRKIIWFMLLLTMVVTYGAFALGSSETTDTAQESQNIEESEPTEVTYETVDLDEMLEELKSNALKAETKYQSKTIEFTGEIASFDSDGSYITVEPIGAGVWNFETVVCNIKNKEQKTYLIEKNVGDTVTIRGKVKSIGEVLGYTVDIAEVE